MIPSETKLNKGAGMKVSKGFLLPETTAQLSLWASYDIYNSYCCQLFLLKMVFQSSRNEKHISIFKNVKPNHRLNIYFIQIKIFENIAY